MFFCLFPSGDTDAVVPLTATRYSIDALGLPTTISWYPWYDNQKVSLIPLNLPLCINFLDKSVYLAILMDMQIILMQHASILYIFSISDVINLTIVLFVLCTYVDLMDMAGRRLHSRMLHASINFVIRCHKLN